MTTAIDTRMNGKICVVTGATSGIGRATASGLAKRGATVVIVARNPEKAAAVIADISRMPGAAPAAAVIADLSEMHEVRRAASEIAARFERVDVLINNAGGMFDTYRESSEGIERAYAVNHLAAVVLTLSLRASLMKARHARVVIVSSNVQSAAYTRDYAGLVRPAYQWSKVYAQTKLRNLIFARTLGARWKADGITVNSLHPGVVNTGLMGGWDNPLMKAIFGVLAKLFISPEDGARTSIFLASDASVAAVTGKYFDRCRPHPYNPVADDPETQTQLWDESMRYLKQAGIDGFGEHAPARGGLAA